MGENDVPITGVGLNAFTGPFSDFKQDRRLFHMRNFNIFEGVDITRHNFMKISALRTISVEN